jgi:adenylate kinase
MTFLSKVSSGLVSVGERIVRLFLVSVRLLQGIFGIGLIRGIQGASQVDKKAVDVGSALRIVLIGPPGAGKGTQAKLLSEHCQIPHISTGDMLRAAVQEGSEIGKLVKSVLDAGNLVDDAIIIELLKQRVASGDCGKGFLLDGCVRTLAQAELIGIELDKLNLGITHVLDFEVSDDLLIERIAERGKISGRSDDSEEIAKTRLKVYRELTLPLTEYYRGKGLLRSVDGVGSVEAVQSRVCLAIGL